MKGISSIFMVHFGQVVLGAEPFGSRHKIQPHERNHKC